MFLYSVASVVEATAQHPPLSVYSHSYVSCLQECMEHDPAMYNNLSFDLTRVSLHCVDVSEATDHPEHKCLHNQSQFVLNLQPTIRQVRYELQHRTIRRWLELNNRRRSQAVRRQ